MWYPTIFSSSPPSTDGRLVETKSVSSQNVPWNWEWLSRIIITILITIIISIAEEEAAILCFRKINVQNLAPNWKKQEFATWKGTILTCQYDQLIIALPPSLLHTFLSPPLYIFTLLYNVHATLIKVKKKPHYYVQSNKPVKLKKNLLT